MRWIGVGLMSIALGACGSAPETPTLAVATPSVRLAAPTGLCASIPSFDTNDPPASLPLTTDPTLQAEFPSEIDGQPVSGLASARLVETLCVLGGVASVEAAKAQLPSPLDMNDIRVASAKATVDGKDVTIVAFRLPGHSGSELSSAVGVLSSVVAPGQQKFTTDLVPTTAGGKSVARWTNAADGSTSYLYPVGDTLFIASDVSPSQADQVIAALP